MIDAIVIGSGPNGLVAACTLARAGWRVLVLEAQPRPGGALYSLPTTLPGFIHNVGAAFFPFAQASPALRSLALHEVGLTWRTGMYESAHPRPTARVPPSLATSTARPPLSGLTATRGAAWRAGRRRWARVCRRRCSRPCPILARRCGSAWAISCASPKPALRRRPAMLAENFAPRRRGASSPAWRCTSISARMIFQAPRSAWCSRCWRRPMVLPCPSAAPRHHRRAAHAPRASRWRSPAWHPRYGHCRAARPGCRDRHRGRRRDRVWQGGPRQRRCAGPLSAVAARRKRAGLGAPVDQAIPLRLGDVQDGLGARGPGAVDVRTVPSISRGTRRR